MSTLETKKIEPLSGTTVTLGAAGDAVTMPAGVTVKTNTVKDAGGNTLWTSDGSGTLSSVNAGLAGGMIFISSQTASSSASVEFTSGIDSTYDEYVFYFVDINPATDGSKFTFQINETGNSGFNNTDITSTAFLVYHQEVGGATHLGYWASGDLATSTSYQILTDGIGYASDECMAGELHLFTPSNATYATHFMSRSQHIYPHSGGPFCMGAYMSGYFENSAAIDEISFKMTSGNFDGNIYMYGIK